MKKIFLFLLVILGMAVSTFSQTSRNVMILSPDKGIVSVVKITENYDTLKIFGIQKEAQVFMNDSNVVKLLNGGVIYLPDSITPRWTHILGVDKLIKRSLRISNNEVCLISKSEFVNPVNENLIKKALLISLVFFIINLLCLLFGDDISSQWVVLGAGMFLGIIILSLKSIDMPWFDAIFISSSFVFITIIFLIVRIRGKIIEKKNKPKYIKIY